MTLLLLSGALFLPWGSGGLAAVPAELPADEESIVQSPPVSLSQLDFDAGMPSNLHSATPGLVRTLDGVVKQHSALCCADILASTTERFCHCRTVATRIHGLSLCLSQDVCTSQIASN